MTSDSPPPAPLKRMKHKTRRKSIASSSHVTLPKNRSRTDLRRPKSTTAIAGNLAQNKIRLLGPSAPRPQKTSNSVFEIGGSDEDVDEEQTYSSTTSLAPSHSSPDLARTSPARDTPLSQLQHKQRSNRAPPAISPVSAQGSHAENEPDFPDTQKTGTSSEVSHFLPPGPNHARHPSSGSEFDSQSQPQSLAPEKPASILLQRTQQRLERERRKALGTPATPPSPHSYTPTHPRSRLTSMTASKQDYDLVALELHVVRRFRNPVVEALARAKVSGLIAPSERPGLAQQKSTGARTTSEQTLISTPTVRRLGSHDDIGLSRSLSSEGQQGRGERLSAEDEVIRRLWECREVYDRDNA